MIRFAALMGTAFMLSGCIGSYALDTIAVTQVASLVSTKHTIDDHLATAATGKDCSVIRASQGGAYCVDPPVPVMEPMVARTTYCYQSLARASCYDRPVERDADGLIGARTDLVSLTPP